MRALYWVLGGFLMAWTAGLAIAADPTPQEIRAKFQETLAASRMAIEVKGGRLSGPGALFLRERAVASQFVLIGEEHGVATIADTVRAYFGDLNSVGYRHFALEADPYMTAKMEAMLRSGGTRELAKFVVAEDHKFTLPFYGWSAEAELAGAVVRANGNALPSLWGLDQVFIGAFGLLLNDIATHASNAEARALAGGLSAQAKGDIQFLGKVEVSEFEKLRALLSGDGDRALAKLADDMILSARIYAPFIGKPGLSVYAANLERENFMKRRFLAHYALAGKPKVFFKFGATHMSRGLSGTHVPALGNFVADFALAEGVQAFNVLVLCGPGTQAGDFQGQAGECEINLAKDLPDLVAHVDARNLTLFDLSLWKDKPRRWEHLREEVRQMIWAFDAVLFVPNGKPAAFLK